MALEVGAHVPKAELFVLGASGPEKFASDELFAGKRVALFGVPGAFTRTCSAKHLPGFVEKADALKAAGADDVMCLATNDVFVLAAWAQAHGAEDKVTMVSDGCLSFTQAAGLEVDLSANGFGPRCKRFSMIVDNGVVTHLHFEQPGEFGETSADVLLRDLTQ